MSAPTETAGSLVGSFRAVVERAKAVATTERGWPAVVITWRLSDGELTEDWIVFPDDADLESGGLSAAGKRKLERLGAALGVRLGILVPRRITNSLDLARLLAALNKRAAIVNLESGKIRGYAAANDVADGGDHAAAKRDADAESPPAIAIDYGPALAAPLPPVTWLCRRFGIVRGRPTILCGYAGSLKTWLAMDLALSVAAGLPTAWDGVGIELTGRVLHLDYENGRESSARRYQRLAKARGIDLAGLGQRLGRASLPRVYLTDPGVEDVLVELCGGVALAIIDSLRAACPDVEENDSAIRRHLDVLGRVTERTGTVFVVLHHERKAPARGGTPGARMHEMRGSSAIADAVDCAIGISPAATEGVFRVEPMKTAWGSPGEPIRVRLVDQGTVEPSSRLSEAVRLEQVDDVDEQQSAGAQARCCDQIRALLADGPLPYKTLRARMHARNETKVEAIAFMRDSGELVDLPSARGAKILALRRAEVPRSPQVPAGPGDRPKVQVPESPALRRGPALGTSGPTKKNKPPGTSPNGAANGQPHAEHANSPSPPLRPQLKLVPPTKEKGPADHDDDRP